MARGSLGGWFVGVGVFAFPSLFGAAAPPPLVHPPSWGVGTAPYLGPCPLRGCTVPPPHAWPCKASCPCRGGRGDRKGGDPRRGLGDTGFITKGGITPPGAPPCVPSMAAPPLHPHSPGTPHVRAGTRDETIPSGVSLGGSQRRCWGGTSIPHPPVQAVLGLMFPVCIMVGLWQSGCHRVTGFWTPPAPSSPTDAALRG